MRRTNKIKRQGFTLVELLIVIVVIGILSAMMMLSSTEATTSARASNIVTNLRNLKTAALAYYTDNLDTYNSSLKLSGSSGEDNLKNLVKYLKAGGNVSTTGLDSEFDGYVFVNDSGAKAWFVGYTKATDARIQEKLKGRAASVQLLGSATIPANNANDKYEKGDTAVYMIVLGGNESTATPNS